MGENLLPHTGMRKPGLVLSGIHTKCRFFGFSGGFWFCVVRAFFWTFVEAFRALASVVGLHHAREDRLEQTDVPRHGVGLERAGHRGRGRARVADVEVDPLRLKLARQRHRHRLHGALGVAITIDRQEVLATLEVVEG